MDFTTRLAFNKPNPDPVTGDPVDISKLNENFDKIDAVIGAAVCTSATRPTTPWNGQFIRETDTGRVLVWSGSAWVIVYNPGDYDAWTQISSPTITWTSTGVAQPSLGNGAIIFRYKKIGRTTNFQFKLFWGGTTTGGDSTGFWGFGGLPSSLDRATSDIHFAGGAWDVSSINLHEVMAQSAAGNGSILNRMYARNAAGALQRMGPTSPFTWASGDILTVAGTFETAS